MRRNYNFAFLDEGSKREIRRATLKAVAIPGYQVPFASREMPIGRGWGTGGLQLTLSCIGPDDVLKVIDQGSDASVNAVSIRRLVRETTGVATTTHTGEATLIQSRHRIPERPLTRDQLLVLQVPTPGAAAHLRAARDRHAPPPRRGRVHGCLSRALRAGGALRHHHDGRGPPRDGERALRHGAEPAIPRYDNAKLNDSENLTLLGAGREKKIYAVPPHTRVESLAFDDHPFVTEDFEGARCCVCGATGVYLTQTVDPATGEPAWQCSDTDFCAQRAAARAAAERGGEA